MSAEALAQVLRPIQGMFDSGQYPNLLVGLDSPDDAAVWKLDERRALVVTTDFFTPVVDDPYDYGAIAAANALSDVYAMGGEPFLALNIAALPPDLPPDIGAEILRGSAEKVREAGVVLAGGHSIQDQEPKIGLVVVGFVDPEKMLTKSGAQPGDILLLTKPLGFGTITTALKRGLAEPSDVAEASSWMKKLNDLASLAARECGLVGGTDITGFSLLGHAWEMAEAAGVQLHFDFDSIPILPGARRYAQDWIFPGGTTDNRLFYQEHIDFGADINEESRMLLFDAQTSGGLLLSAPAAKLECFMTACQELGQPVWVVGRVFAGGARITVQTKSAAG